jgi:multidrug efflux pump subunit AcrB
MTLVRIALRNPYLVTVVALGFLVLGVVSFFKLPVDLLPSFKTPAVQVVTFYPGMPAEIVERDITNRLERWTGQADGIARQESKSMVGVSILRDYFRDDIDSNTAMSQVASLAQSDMFYLPPGTIPPLVMLFDPTATMPLCILRVYGDKFGEKELYDVAYFSIRNQLSGLPGVIAPAVFGGKLRRILLYLDRDKLVANGLAPLDVVKALRSFNLIIPTGNAKIGNLDYSVFLDSMVASVEELNDIPVKVHDGATVFVRDVARAKDSFAIQTNIAHINGKREVYIPIYRRPGANSVDVVEGVKKALSLIGTRIPEGMKLDVILDQSRYIRESMESLGKEAGVGALLAGVLILVFLGSLRSTFAIVLAIPLSILVAFIGLRYTSDSLNAMTLGGLALAIGRLVDDAIVVLENVVRHLRMGKAPAQAAEDGAGEVAMPVLVATLTTIAVFFPITFLTGMGHYLFAPMAKAVAFSMAGSYLMAMTVVPAFCARFLREGAQGRFARLSERMTDSLQRTFGVVARAAVRGRILVVALALGLLVATSLSFAEVGQELFPPSDSGQFVMRMRLPSGTRIERTEETARAVEAHVRRVAPEARVVLANVGVLYDWPAAYTPNSGSHDAFFQIELDPERAGKGRVLEIVSRLRAELPAAFPGVELNFDTAGILGAALNFGLPSPIDIQVEGNDLHVAARIAQEVKRRIERVPGAVDVRIQQRLDYPQLDIKTDRAKVAKLGLTQEHVVKGIVTALNSSINFEPSFWIDYKTGNHYFVGATYAESDIHSLSTLEEIPLSTGNALTERPAPAVVADRGALVKDRAAQASPALLKNVATFGRSSAPAEVNHYNIARVIDVYANVSGRDAGGVARDIEAQLADLRLPKGYVLRTRGEVQSMRESFRDLSFGFGLATILVYLILVALFRSFVDPLIILVAVPLGLPGVLALLAATGVTLNVQSFMGVIFMVGVAVSNSVLLVEFANRLRREGQSAREAAAEAAQVRLRPILITSITSVLGLLPVALAVGDPLRPLALAVVGGLATSTVLVLVVVPAVYALVHGRKAT